MNSRRAKHIAIPEALKPGDSIALIRPAAALEEARFEHSLRVIREAGFFAVTYPGEFKKDTYFSSDDKSRAEEWSWAFSQPGIRAVLSCRAGYGLMRTVYQLFKKKSAFQSKLFVGYSDTTFAHQWIVNRFKHLSFHGPLVGHLADEDLRFFLQQIVDLPDKAHEQKWDEVELHQEGKASGQLVGGNLSLLQTAGTAMLPHRPLILAVEDVNEDFYRLDRLLWSLIHAGYKKWIKGIIFGSFEKCGKDAERFPFEKVLETSRELCGGPIWMKANFGHGLTRQRILPLGASVELHSNKIRFKHGLVKAR